MVLVSPNSYDMQKRLPGRKPATDLKWYTFLTRIVGVYAALMVMKPKIGKLSEWLNWGLLKWTAGVETALNSYMI